MTTIATVVLVFQMMGVETGSLYEPKMESIVYGSKAKNFCKRADSSGLKKINDQLGAYSDGESGSLRRFGRKKGLKPVVIEYTCGTLELTKQ